MTAGRIVLIRIISALVILIGLAAPAWADTKACEDAWERRGYEAALKNYHPLADRGDIKAQYELGNMYYLGMGAPQCDGWRAGPRHERKNRETGWR